ncbi:coiled-coil domain-containing protein 115-like [Chenopodium quinoa]|uniref:coiled-coil domain-containing protein 115-like n=1 Tax=Chenopodium quinoa TaxID=63459 RepID=UPI000B783B2C|nr:coiled-coil domain-containing protein 115-like [Chenopodium quinoa]
MSEIESSITELHNAATADHDDLKQKNDNDEDVLKFMDSVDSYLLLLDELSSTLRQGWFDFASARYSMGTSRVNSVLLDLKEHSAATRLEVEKGDEPHFTLCKWVSEDAADSEKMKEGNSGLQQKSESMRQRHKDVSQTTAKEDSSPSGSSNPFAQVQKERSKSLAVFGSLGSPKLGAAQLSFETALEKLVEIANMRASMLHAFEQVHQRIDGIED